MRLTVVVGVQGGAHLLEPWVRRLRAQEAVGVEVLLVWAGGDEEAAAACQAASADWIRPVEGPARALIPMLWATGIRASVSDRVALTVHHCEPAEGWIQALLGANLAEHAGVGGPITQHASSDGLGWAIYLQRYAPFSVEAVGPAPRPTHQIAGDNALYRRDRLDEVADSWAQGFWELEVHERLRERGRSLGVDPALLVTHRNGYSGAGFAEQRLRHGFLFGANRARRLSPARRLGYRALSPAIPLLFGRKVLARALGSPAARPHLGRSLPWMALFVGAWSLGEALGAAMPAGRAA